MPPTTLKLPTELRQRIQAVVANTGTSMHAFMLEAIERETRLAEQRGSFVADALAARDELETSGTAFEAREVHAYFRSRVAGKRVAPPKAKRWRR